MSKQTQIQMQRLTLTPFKSNRNHKKLNIKPPFFSNSIMSTCYAMTDKGKRCRAYSIINSATCKPHQNHFNDDLVSKWIQKNIKNLEFYPARRIYIESALKHGLVQVTKEHIASISPHSSYTYFILLCARHTDFVLDWNPKLSAKVLRTLWKRVGAIGPVVITYEDIFAMFRTNIVSGFYGSLLAYPHSNAEINWFEFFELSSRAQWFQELIHYSYNMKVVDEVIVHLKKLSRAEAEHSLLHIFESGEYMAWFLNKKRQFYASLERKIEPIKEELLALTWTPERVMEWCMDDSQRATWVS